MVFYTKIFAHLDVYHVASLKMLVTYCEADIQAFLLAYVMLLRRTVHVLSTF